MSFWKTLGSGLPWFFGQNVDELERSHFGDDVLTYLRTTPIKLSDDHGRPIYVHIDPAQIKKSETAIDEQLTFKFRLTESPIPEADPFRNSAPNEPGFVIIKVPMGRIVSSDPVFGYTLSSINTFEQNRANLENFVQQQWQQLQLDCSRMK